MYSEILTQLGLNQSQIEVYNHLLTGGEQPAAKISLKTSLNRTNVYNVLAELARLGLVEETPKGQAKKGAKTTYRLIHPNKLRDLLESKSKELQQAQTSLASSLPRIISDFNLAVGRPGVRFYEGNEGLAKVMEDSLTAQSEILTYVDAEAVEKYIKKENDAYVKKRRKLGKKKKILVPDSEFNKKFFQALGSAQTDVRYLDFAMPEFSAAMQIYDDKITYITMQSKKMIGIIIEDELIAKMHKSLFEYNWSTAKLKLI